ncbi:RagB/SusD family nutrient uptake outer membrane protein [Polaribacter pectinis]|uniref:RagB/SusD family nutrient uptake outer membrane protein n=1 Tax=Polaribacter pectinis TaxID=2738844 RepID=A0A7G9L9L1_9FLAO|nr:RagB/SusD family nutrient uptake outer membrane protein [Polaribacter pectinis]QNM85310.1 RagB/SusD family nutrient uptake outer membrane protein [Polaribacter pectinis]
MKQIKFLALLVITIFATSCEDTFLSPELTTGINAESYYANDEEIEKAVINIYDGIQGVNSFANSSSTANHAVQVEFYVTEMRSDNTRTKSQEGESAQFDSFKVEATNGFVADYYRSFYNVIFRSNVVLENLEAATADNAIKFEAEAKFLRAYAYFNLVRLFGDIPLIDRVITPADKETAYTRVAVANIYDLITSDLLTAIDGLDDTHKNRASLAAAEALLAKVYLTQPSPNYSGAQALCESIMQPTRGFSLISNFRDIFYTEGNDEVIFAIGYESGSSVDSQNFSAEWLNAVGRTSGVNYVTTEGVAALDAMGGDRTAVSYRVDVGQPTQNQVTKYLPNGEDGGADGKTFSSNAQLSGNDWIVSRYADVVLMHVEAIMAGGPSTSSSVAVASFNSVRRRANVADDADGIIEKSELLDERRVELAFENQRLFDLIRMGEAVNILSTFSNDNAYDFSTTDLLLPIPQYEINLSNGLLTQNPGY